MPGKEIEKKFLLNALPTGVSDGVMIRQGYLSTGDPEVRVRFKGGKFFLTRKGGEGFSRDEEEIEISSEVFDILWPLAVDRSVEKTRYAIKANDGHVWEIDEYQGRLVGMFIAEVELQSELTEAVIPDAVRAVMKADVTLDKRFKNKRLAECQEIPCI